MLCEYFARGLWNCTLPVDPPRGNRCRSKTCIVDYKFARPPKPTSIYLCPFVSSMVGACPGGFRSARCRSTGSDGEAPGTLGPGCANSIGSATRSEYSTIQGQQGARKEIILAKLTISFIKFTIWGVKVYNLIGCIMNKIKKKTEQVRQFILENVEDHPTDITSVVSDKFDISRQASHRHIYKLVQDGLLASHGTTRNRKYEVKPLGQFSA